MAEGGIQKILAGLGATVRVEEARLTADEDTEYGGWKRLGMALGHFADIVAKNERDGYFTVGLLATCPSMPGLVAGLQRSGPTREPIKIGMLWLDAHPDFNTPETTRSGSLGGMPVAVATGRALQVMRLDAKLDPPLPDRHVVMGGVRLTDPLEQKLLDNSMIEQLSVDDLRNMTPAVFAQLDRLNRLTDKIYVHIDMDVLDPREVMAHGNKVPNGPSSEQLASLFEADLHALSQGVRDRLRDDSADRRRRPVDRRGESHDRRRRARREGRDRSSYRLSAIGSQLKPPSASEAPRRWRRENLRS